MTRPIVLRLYEADGSFITASMSNYLDSSLCKEYRKRPDLHELWSEATEPYSRETDEDDIIYHNGYDYYKRIHLTDIVSTREEVDEIVAYFIEGLEENKRDRSMRW